MDKDERLRIVNVAVDAIGRGLATIIDAESDHASEAEQMHLVGATLSFLVGNFLALRAPDDMLDRLTHISIMVETALRHAEEKKPVYGKKVELPLAAMQTKGRPN